MAIELVKQLEATASRIAAIESYLSAKDAERKAEIRKATEEIDARYRAMPDIVAHRAEVDQLRQQHSDLRYKIADAKASSDPDVGRRVVRYDRYGGYGFSRKNRRLVGIVEIRTRDSQMPSNRQWGMPQIGQKMIRLLKADGKPGKLIEPFKTLADEEASRKRQHERYGEGEFTPMDAERAKYFWQFEGEEVE